MRIPVKTLVVLTALLWSGLAQAQWSANIGWVSDYYFRGIFQSDSSASGGLDFEQNGFYVGTWAADVDDGLEIDGYAGYGGEVGDFSYGIGFTGYYYTGDFDDTYQEINLSGGYGPVTADVAFGEYDNFGGSTQDYTYWSLTVEHAGFYGTVAGFSRDFEGEYIEVGYGTTISEIDFSLSVVIGNDDLVGEDDDDGSLVFGIAKSFDL